MLGRGQFNVSDSALQNNAVTFHRPLNRHSGSVFHLLLLVS